MGLTTLQRNLQGKKERKRETLFLFYLGKGALQTKNMGAWADRESKCIVNSLLCKGTVCETERDRGGV